jgi:hypothetical protein
MAEMVRKSSADEILNHWILALSCILLIITGFAFLFQMESVGSVFGGFNTMKTVHNWGGVIFSLSLLYSMRHYLKDAFEYDADDRQWFKVAGGYLSKNVKVPPMGKSRTEALLSGHSAGRDCHLPFRLRHLADEGKCDRDAPFASCAQCGVHHLCYRRAGPYLSQYAGQSGNVPDHGERHPAAGDRQKETSQMDESDREDVVSLINNSL